MKFEWEDLENQHWAHIENSINVGTARAKVFGGWIIRSIEYHQNESLGIAQSESMVFVPDSKHEWSIQ